MSVSIDSNLNTETRLPGRPLSSCAAGFVEVLNIDPALSCASRLREMCLLEGQLIKVVRRSDPLLLDVRGSLIAIDLETAAGIEVRDAHCG